MRLIAAEHHATWSGRCAAYNRPHGSAKQHPPAASPDIAGPRSQRRQADRVVVAASGGGAARFADIDQEAVQAINSSQGSDADLAAEAGEAAQPDATSVEKARLLAVAKQRIGVLRAAKAAQRVAQQPFTAAEQQPSALESSEAAAAVRPVVDDQAADGQAAAAERQPLEPASAAAAAPQPSSQSTASSPGAVAARSSRQREAVSATAAWAPAAGSAPAFPPKNPKSRRRVQRSTETVDAQRYEQVAASRNRLASQLSRANRYVAHLEAELAGRSADASAAAASLAQTGVQVQQLLRQAGLAAGDSAAGSSGGSTQAYALTQMLARFQQQLQRHQRRLEESAVQAVPLVWVGAGAQEVRLMGSFDGWSRGVALSSAEGAGDSVFHRFEGTLHARRGDYTVKFLVDGQWRLALHWPTRDDAEGTTNNVLQIE